jgi:hypothetical protein
MRFVNTLFLTAITSILMIIIGGLFSPLAFAVTKGCSTVKELLENIDKCNAQKVEIAGRATEIKHQVSLKGHAFTKFLLDDYTSEPINVFSYTHLPIAQGDSVKVTGVFKKAEPAKGPSYPTEIAARHEDVSVIQSASGKEKLSSGQGKSQPSAPTGALESKAPSTHASDASTITETQKPSRKRWNWPIILIIATGIAIATCISIGIWYAFFRKTQMKKPSLKLNLFRAESEVDPQKMLSDIKRKATDLDESVQQSTNLEDQIRNSYPFPVAYVYRTLEGITSLHDLYKEQLRLAENVFAFLGSIMLAVLEEKALNQIGPNLVEIWRGGISPGHWKQLCIKISPILKESKLGPLATSLSSLWLDRGKKAFRDSFEKLIVAKNDFKHDRGPKIEEEFLQYTERTKDSLLVIMQHLSFLTEHPLRLITDFDRIRNSAEINVKCLRYAGDHPGFQQEQIKYNDIVKKNDIYIELQPGSWRSLFPFITVHNCPHCRTREIYFIDYFAGEGKSAKLKSFERGHTEESREIGEAILKWS